MRFASLITTCLAIVSSALAANKTAVTYLGAKGPILSGGTAGKGLVFVSGTVPSLNGTIVSGGIRNETRQVIENIAAILEEGGSSWKYVFKTTVFLANISDFAAMNEVYGALLPSPKPARTTIQAGRLPGNFSIEIEATAAIPEF